MFKLRNNKCLDQNVIKSLLLHKYNDILSDDIKISNKSNHNFLRYLSNYTGFPKFFLEISEYLNISIDTIKQQYLQINNNILCNIHVKILFRNSVLLKI